MTKLAFQALCWCPNCTMSMLLLRMQVQEELKTYWQIQLYLCNHWHLLVQVMVETRKSYHRCSNNNFQLPIGIEVNKCWRRVYVRTELCVICWKVQMLMPFHLPGHQVKNNDPTSNILCHVNIWAQLHLPVLHHVSNIFTCYVWHREGRSVQVLWCTIVLGWDGHLEMCIQVPS